MTTPIRVLHVLGRMNRGGAETWLMHVLRNIDRTRFAFDFLVHTTEASAYDDEILALGSRIIQCPRPQSLSYPLRLRRALSRWGPYGAVHSHVHSFSGLVLAVAATAGVPIRIAHSHTSAMGDGFSLGRSLYLRAAKRLVRLTATRGLAVSRTAAESLFGPRWWDDGRWTVQHLGIDFAPFHRSIDSRQVRIELGIPEDAFVIGHVGRIDAAKNHAFLLAVAAAAMRRRPDTWLLLVGDGPLRVNVEQRAHELGVSHRAVFAGIRGDVPRILRGAMNVFVMPSLYEGLPLAAIEAQAAGLPVLLSDTITPEAIVINEQCRVLGLSESPDIWATALLSPFGHRAESSLSTLRDSSFALSRCIAALCAEYSGCETDPPG